MTPEDLWFLWHQKHGTSYLGIENPLKMTSELSKAAYLEGYRQGHSDASEDGKGGIVLEPKEKRTV